MSPFPPYPSAGRRRGEGEEGGCTVEYQSPICEQLASSQVHKQGSKSDYRQPRPRQMDTPLLRRSCHDQYSHRLTGVEVATPRIFMQQGARAPPLPNTRAEILQLFYSTSASLGWFWQLEERNRKIFIKGTHALYVGRHTATNQTYLKYIFCMLVNYHSIYLHDKYLYMYLFLHHIHMHFECETINVLIVVNISNYILFTSIISFHCIGINRK